ncbi:MAG: DNA primase catalytic subunit PriS [Methanoregula sp.]
MNPATTAFVRQRFLDYYQKAMLVSPSSLEQREWGFVLFNPGATEMRMHRHIAFLDHPMLFDYIRNLVPSHVYYSSAYYEKPDAPTMAEKIWCGADLIFDLDADHIVKGAYDQMLSRVKTETEKLLAMLNDELGIDPKQIELVFSGGRGYHVHVKDLAFRGWGSAERRELVDYICGIGLDPAILLNGSLSMSGWPVRFRVALIEYLEWLGSVKEEEAIAYLTTLEGVGKESAYGFLKKRAEMISTLRGEFDSTLLKDRVIKAIIHETEGEFRKRLNDKAALADEPVTTDIKRLIRKPTSLHGGSGMRVQPIEVRDLTDFDPLVDAVVFSDRDVRVDVRFPLTMPMLGSTYQIQKGISKVPEAVAVFLCSRGIAEIA